MSDMFKNMDNYNVILRNLPDAYGYVRTTAIVGKNNGNTVYNLDRTIQYQSAFSGARGYIFAGLMGLYNKVFELLKDKDTGNGELKNYFVVGIVTDSDDENRILTYNLHFIQKDNYEELLKSEEFTSIPNIDDETVISIVMNFGYQFSGDMDSININNSVYNVKCFKESHDSIKAYGLKEGKTFDLEDEDTKSFIDTLLNENAKSIYKVGLKKEG